MVDDLPQKKVEEYSYKINKLIEEARCNLTISIAEIYSDDAIKNIDKNWKQALSKIEETEKLIQELLKLISADKI